jgi:hypothetical protein
MRVDTMPPPVRQPKPWYREGWPWALMAGPALVVVAAMVTIWLAVATDDGVIADDYYKRGLVINKELDRVRRAETLRLGAVLDVAADGALRLRLQGLPGATPAPSSIEVKFAHATRAGSDRMAALARGPDGRYAGRIAPLPPGRWLVSVAADDWRLPTEEAVVVSGEVRLGAARAGR